MLMHVGSGRDGDASETNYLTVTENGIAGFDVIDCNLVAGLDSLGCRHASVADLDLLTRR